MDKIAVAQFRAGDSNYNYIVYHPVSKSALVVDPLAAEVVMNQVNALGVRVKVVLNTHGHYDHISGNGEVMQATGAKLLAGQTEKIPDVSHPLKNNEEFTFDGIHLRVLHTPGHTPGHITVIINEQYLFVGDTLFVGGCGNCLYGGNMDDLYDSLQKFAALPDHLRICCGHEYALKNLQFCAEHDPKNAAVTQAAARIKKNLADGHVISSTLGEERSYNAFLRAPDKCHFKQLREARNRF